MIEPKSLKRGWAEVAAYISGTAEFLAPEILTQVLCDDPLFLGRIADLLTAVDDDCVGYNHSAQHLAACGRCQEEAHMIEAAVSEARPEWLEFARSIKKGDVSLLILAGATWRWADRKSRRLLEPLATTAHALGDWTFQPVAERFALASPRPSLSGEISAFNGTMGLVVRVIPTFVVTQNRDEWQLEVTLEKAALQLIRLEVREDPSVPGFESRQLVPGASVKLPVKPPRRKPYWLFLMAKSLSGEWLEQAVELPLLDRAE